MGDEIVQRTLQFAFFSRTSGLKFRKNRWPEDAEFNVNCGAKIVGSLPSIAVTENGNSSCSRCGPEYFNEILKVLLYNCEIEKWLRSFFCTRKNQIFLS